MIISAYSEMVNSPGMGISREILSPKYQPCAPHVHFFQGAWGKIIGASFYPAWAIAGNLERIFLFPDRH